MQWLAAQVRPGGRWRGLIEAGEISRANFKGITKAKDEGGMRLSKAGPEEGGQAGPNRHRLGRAWRRVAACLKKRLTRVVVPDSCTQIGTHRTQLTWRLLCLQYLGVLGF